MSESLLAHVGASPNVASRVQRSRTPAGLKVCLISETLHAGVGRHIVDTISALSERGHEIHLLYSPVRLEPAFLATLARQPNVVCRAVMMPRAIGLSDVTAFSQILSYVRENGPFDIVHGHSAKGGGYARLLKLFGRHRVLYSPHAFITSSPVLGLPKRAVYHGIETVLSRLTDRLVCCSSAEQWHARQFGFSADRLSVIANGGSPVETERRDTIREGLGLSGNDVVVGFVGRMEEQKAPERLILVARRLLPELPHLRFLMIGDGPKRPALESDLRQAGLSERVLWLGAIDARRYLPAMDVFAMCSLYEGFAYVMLEALFAGLPIVSTPVGGTREGIFDGINGFIVPQGDLDHMARAIRDLATDADLRSSMATASRQRAQQFTIPRMIDALETLYWETQERATQPQRAPVLASDAPSAT